MPCRSDFEPISSHPTYKETKLQNRVEDLCKDLKTAKGLADEATQLLCYLCGVVREQTSILDYVDVRLQNWLKKHDEFDENRTLTELMKRYKAISVEMLLNDRVKENALKEFIGKAEKIHPLSNWHRTVYFDKLWNMLIEKKKTEFSRDKKLMEIESLKARLKQLESEL